ncbi:hypothetical protein BU26DRAFT_286768 [Trematosphaeria pertusa]|uniref:Uncharacterized protein n=1 Tax=Trematosphaeria pertusa TaxID=390896 RepID=A0A6A6II85_9PLEO|nr:uncharacterized protein BU26DRAFT_286768 [Trematosphaeria pertusa]KAF2249612.1 hypothetical protein BU26DRAFT_286768 [Trematosphaeria pertusa]
MSREQKLLCKKLVAWFILITQYVDKPRRGVTQELLSLLTGLAHYLKLLIRIGLRGLISLDPYDKQGDISGFLDKVETTDQTSFQTALQEKLRSSDYISRNADICAACETSVEINPKQGCYWTRSQIYHFDCVSCPNCDAAPKLTNTDTGDSWVECSRCSYVYHNFFKECFILRTSFLLSTHLLMVAWARLAATLKPDAGLMELILPERSLGAGVSAKTQERGAGDDEIPPSRTCPSGWKAYLSAP